MTVTYSQVPSQSQGIGTIPVTADTYRTEEVSGEGDRTKGGAEAIDHDVSSVPEPDHLGAGVPDDDDTREDVGALRREVLEVAEAATRGDEIAAVSAMVTAAETAALREAMGGPHVPPTPTTLAIHPTMRSAPILHPRIKTPSPLRSARGGD